MTKVPAPLRGQIATRQNDVVYTGFLNVLQPQDDVLATRGAGKGLRLYEELKRDPTVFSVLQKRELAIVGREWVMEPGGPGRRDKAAARTIEDWLRAMPFDRWCRDMASALLMGFSVGELMWGVWDDQLVAPLALKPINPRRIVFDVEERPRLLTRQASLAGEPLPEEKFLIHRVGGIDDPYGLGLGAVLFWPTFFKRQNIAYWMVFQDRFGSPTVKASYEVGTPETEQELMMNRMAALAQEGVVIFPKGWDLGLLEASRSGTLTYADLCAYMDGEIAKAVLGETLSTEAGAKGSQALGTVHNEVRMELTDSDCDLQSDSINAQLLTWVCRANFPGAKPPRLWRPRPEREEDQTKLRVAKSTARSAALRFVSDMRANGWEPEDSASDLEGQADGAWRYVGKAAPESPPPLKPTSFAEPAPAPRDAIDDLAEQLDTVAAPALDRMINQIRDLVAQVDAEGGTLQDVADRLIRLYPQMEDQALGQAMAQAMTLAGLHGHDVSWVKGVV